MGLFSSKKRYPTMIEVEDVKKVIVWPNVCPTCVTRTNEAHCTFCGSVSVPLKCEKCGRLADTHHNFCAGCGGELKWCRNKERKAAVPAAVSFSQYYPSQQIYPSGLYGQSLLGGFLGGGLGRP